MGYGYQPEAERGAVAMPASTLVAEYYGILATVAAEEYRGTITRKELEYNEAQKSIPVYNIPLGKRGLVHVWGRNDMATHQMVGIHWIVREPPTAEYPDGRIAEEYSTWEGMTAGEEDDFIGGRFDLNKVGTWIIDIKLLMGQ